MLQVAHAMFKSMFRWHSARHVLTRLLLASAQCELAWLCVNDILHGSL